MVTRYHAHRSAGRYLAVELVLPLSVAARPGLAESDAIDGYLGATDIVDVMLRHGLIGDEAGRTTLRATTMDLDVVRDLAERSVVLAALDLAESLDVRERGIGLEAIDRALEAFRD